MKAMDLLTCIRTQNGKLTGYKLIGVLAGEIEKPSHIAHVGFFDSTMDRCAVMDLVGLVAPSGDMYYVNGRAIVVVNKYDIAKMNKKVSKRMAITIQCTIKTANVEQRGNVLDNVVHVFNWRKENNTWKIARGFIQEVNPKEFPEFHTVLLNAFNNNWEYKYPVEFPSGATPACDGFEFDYFDLAVPSNSGANYDEFGLRIDYSANSQIKSDTAGFTDDIRPIDNLLTPVSQNLGVAQGSTVSTLANNKAQSMNSRRVFKAINRPDFLEMTPDLMRAKTSLERADEKLTVILDELNAIPTDDRNFSLDLKFFVESLRKNWATRNGQLTGRAFLKRLLERVLPEFDTKTATGDTEIGNLIQLKGNLVAQFLLEEPDNAPDIEKKIYENAAKIYLCALEDSLGIRAKLRNAYDTSLLDSFDVFNVLNENPYLLGVLAQGFNLEDLDKLAMLYGTNMNLDSVKKLRNAAYMHSFMLDNDNYCVKNNTMIAESDLVRHVKGGKVVCLSTYTVISAEGSLVNQAKVDQLQLFITPNVSLKDFKVPKAGWVKIGQSYVLSENVDSRKLLEDYLESGLGVNMTLSGVKYVADIVFVKRELFIFKKLKEITDRMRDFDNVSREEIDRYISEFEELKAEEFNLGVGGFKLEKMQREACHLVKNPVMAVTGGAGMGKTTTAEALIYVAQNALGIPDESIMFCAPTGRAAGRLKEVVKRKTRTAHSLFGISGESFSVKTLQDIRKKDEIELLIMDEMSMMNINLMYEVMLRVTNTTRMYFLGDIAQLSPIGFGKPFADMLRYIPCVVLDVSKRAGANSGITINSNALNESDVTKMQNLKDFDDFRVVHTTDEVVVINAISELCRYHLGKTTCVSTTTPLNVGAFNPDDIQVIMPIKKNVWGTVAMNPILQDIFNPKKKGSKVVSFSKGPNEQPIELRMNDRVIHTYNKAKAFRFVHSQEDKNLMIRLDSSGVFNGDIGKIEGVYKSTDLIFEHSDGAPDEEAKIAHHASEHASYLAVTYKDVDIETDESIDFMVLYRMEEIHDSNNELLVKSLDLMHLELAYALTVHKLQGSQAKLLIGAILKCGGEDFLSRNMLYTLTSRGKTACYMIGDIVGSMSALNKARMVEQTSQRLSLCDVACQ